MTDYVLQNIEVERIKSRLTRREIATELGITPKTYINWIRCKTEIPSGALLHMSKLFKVTVDYLLER